MSIFFPSAYAEQAKQFFTAYKEEKFAACPEEKIRGLKPAAIRFCRFCKKDASQTTFRKEAHIFPYGLGNKYLVSDFECDACNELFNKYEDSLMNYLGISRTISKTKGRKNVPGFLSKDIKASEQTIFETHKVIKVESREGPLFEVDSDNQKYITYLKPPYIPLYVYKSLLKMALCLVDEKDLDKYSDAFSFLLSKNLESSFKPCMIFGHRLPKEYKDPFGILFRKRESTMNTTTNTFLLFYNSFMLQIFLPYHSDDRSIVHFEVPLAPPYFDGSGDEELKHLYQTCEDFSSGQKVSDDVEVLTLGIDKTQYENIVAYDPITKKITKKQYNPSEIVGIYLSDKDFEIPL
jgi:hypothetical protein